MQESRSETNRSANEMGGGIKSLFKQNQSLITEEIDHGEEWDPIERIP